MTKPKCTTRTMSDLHLLRNLTLYGTAYEDYVKEFIRYGVLKICKFIYTIFLQEHLSI